MKIRLIRLSRQSRRRRRRRIRRRRRRRRRQTKRWLKILSRGSGRRNKLIINIIKIKTILRRLSIISRISKNYINN